MLENLIKSSYHIEHVIISFRILGVPFSCWQNFDVKLLLWFVKMTQLAKFWGQTIILKITQLCYLHKHMDKPLWQWNTCVQGIYCLSWDVPMILMKLDTKWTYRVLPMYLSILTLLKIIKDYYLTSDKKKQAHYSFYV